MSKHTGNLYGSILMPASYQWLQLDRNTTDIMENGCNGFVQKPFGIEELSRKVRQALKDPPAGTAARRET